MSRTQPKAKKPKPLTCEAVVNFPDYGPLKCWLRYHDTPTHMTILPNDHPDIKRPLEKYYWEEVPIVY